MEQLTSRDVMVLCAMVDRLNKEKTVMACQLKWLLEILVKNGVLSSDENIAFQGAVKEQLEVVKKTELAENEFKDPSAAPLPAELTQELNSLGVVSNSPRIADTLDTDFEEVLQKVLAAFRRSTGQGGDAGSMAQI